MTLLTGPPGYAPACWSRNPFPLPACLAAGGGLLDGRPELVLPLRCLLGVRSGTADWKGFLDLEGHLHKRRLRPVWEERQKGVVEVRSSGLACRWQWVRWGCGATS